MADNWKDSFDSRLTLMNLSIFSDVPEKSAEWEKTETPAFLRRLSKLWDFLSRNLGKRISARLWKQQSMC